MSFEKGIFGDDAEYIFWETSELVDKLLSYLDLTSIKQLAESHKVTRHILGNAFAWKKLIKRMFPEDEITHNWSQFISGIDETSVLASERAKASCSDPDPDEKFPGAGSDGNGSSPHHLQEVSHPRPKDWIHPGYDSDRGRQLLLSPGPPSVILGLSAPGGC